MPSTSVQVVLEKSLMADLKWLEQASQWHELYGYVLKVMTLNPGLVELEMHNTSVKVVLESKILNVTNQVWQICIDR